jgi:hypothetical protein
VAALAVALAAGTRGLGQADLAGLAGVAKKYSIRVVSRNERFPVKTTYGPIAGQAAASKDLASYAPVLATEFSVYPAEFVKKTGLERIVLCQGLAFNGQRRTAIPDFEHNTLYLDVARGRYSDSYTRKVIHHEFYHIVDLKDDGNLYQDKEWEKLNAPGFKYGAGGRALQDDSTVSLINDARPGFLNKYSTSGVEEDKAEIFANMVVNYQAVAERGQRDKVVAAKTELMKRETAKFCPQMNATFWEAMRKRDGKSKAAN